mmetsp:Transcript_25239/g.54908  ORF Transcript_25239/g.54908 Transcript_25239/m.54908 type:complete len:203 (-) Transcript_25239:43-651(-)
MMCACLGSPCGLCGSFLLIDDVLKRGAVCVLLACHGVVCGGIVQELQLRCVFAKRRDYHVGGKGAVGSNLGRAGGRCVHALQLSPQHRLQAAGGHLAALGPLRAVGWRIRRCRISRVLAVLPRGALLAPLPLQLGLAALLLLELALAAAEGVAALAGVHLHELVVVQPQLHLHPRVVRRALRRLRRLRRLVPRLRLRLLRLC